MTAPLEYFVNFMSCWMVFDKFSYHRVIWIIIWPVKNKWLGSFEQLTEYYYDGLAPEILDPFREITFTKAVCEQTVEEE